VTKLAKNDGTELKHYKYYVKIKVTSIDLVCTNGEVNVVSFQNIKYIIFNYSGFSTTHTSYSLYWPG
jgi:hypothetical protein